MADDTHQFKIPSMEFEYLKGLSKSDKHLAELLRGEQVPSDGRVVTLRLSRASANELGDWLTLRLAQVGFDQNYSANTEAQLLETLIDRFFVP